MRDKTNLLIKSINEFTSSQIKRASMFEEMDEDHYLFESTWLSTTVEQIDKKMINEYEQIIRRKKEREMGGIPWWLIIFIAFFVYDDVWFPRDEYPILFHTLTFPLVLILLLYAIGQGSVVQEIIRIIADKLKSIFPFLR